MACMYSPIRDLPEMSSNVTLWDLFKDAATHQYGGNILFANIPLIKHNLNDLNFVVIVERADNHPTEKTRTILDINLKEYINPCEKESDETFVKIWREATKTEGSRFKFYTSQVIGQSLLGNIGARIMGLSVSGGAIIVSVNKHNTALSEPEDEFRYEQGEKIAIPPRTRVKASVTSYSIKYEQAYTLRFSISHNIGVSFRYESNDCCCSAWCRGYVTAAQMLRTLPGYHHDHENSTVSFVQQGILTWIGHGSSIDKIVEPLDSTSS